MDSVTLFCCSDDSQADSVSLFDPSKPPIFDSEFEVVFDPSKPPIYDEEYKATFSSPNEDLKRHSGQIVNNGFDEVVEDEIWSSAMDSWRNKFGCSWHRSLWCMWRLDRDKGDKACCLSLVCGKDGVMRPVEHQTILAVHSKRVWQILSVLGLTPWHRCIDVQQSDLQFLGKHQSLNAFVTRGGLSR